MREYYGEDKLGIILVNREGGEKRSDERAEDCIQRYGMEGVPRVPFGREEYIRHVAGNFSQFGYGKFVIDAEGILRGIDLRGQELHDVLDQACGKKSGLDLEGFKLEFKTRTDRSGRPGMNLSDYLTERHEARLMLKLTLPEGWHIGSLTTESLTPTEVSVKEVPGLTIGEPKVMEGEAWSDVVKIVFPISAEKGLVIGKYLITGRLKFVACNEDGCLPPVDVPWKTSLEVM